MDINEIKEGLAPNLFLFNYMAIWCITAIMGFCGGYDGWRKWNMLFTSEISLSLTEQPPGPCLSRNHGRLYWSTQGNYLNVGTQGNPGKKMASIWVQKIWNLWIFSIFSYCAFFPKQKKSTKVWSVFASWWFQPIWKIWSSKKDHLTKYGWT